MKQSARRGRNNRKYLKEEYSKRAIPTRCKKIIIDIETGEFIQPEEMDGRIIIKTEQKNERSEIRGTGTYSQSVAYLIYVRGDGE